VAGAALAAVIAEAAGFLAGLAIAWRLAGRHLDLSRARVFDRARLARMIAVNRDIMIRTAALIAAFFFTATGARAGDITLAANAVLQNLVLIASFFLDGFATAAEQLCGYAVGARNRSAFERAVSLAIGWGFIFALTLSVGFVFGGSMIIDRMTTNPQVRETARQFLLFAALVPLAGVLAYAFDGIYVGATWAPDMRNLMLAALACYLASWWVLQSAGNAGLWTALIVFLITRGLFQAVRYPALARATFR
jgi:multidrug resistance protein, MATE family